VDYPADIFSASGGQADRGFGERFRTPDSQAIFQVYSLPNVPRITPSGYLRANLVVRRSQLTYERITPWFFAISNVQDGTIHYSRCNFGRGRRPVISCFDLQYPADQKRAWDDAVTRISRSLRTPDNG
jgi:hypothetical protein